MNSVYDTLSNEYADLARTITTYDQLGDDWDGEGAVAPTVQMLDDALYFLEKLATRYPNIRAPNLGPCADGSIDFFWPMEDGKLLLINIDKKGGDYYGESHANQQTHKVKGVLDLEHLNLDFVQFMEGEST